MFQSAEITKKRCEQFQSERHCSGILWEKSSVYKDQSDLFKQSLSKRAMPLDKVPIPPSAGGDTIRLALIATQICVETTNVVGGTTS